MNEERQCCLAGALDEDNRLRVHLIPMPSGDNPWRAQGDYRKEQRRDTWRFIFTIAALVIAMGGTAATALTAMSAISSCPS